MQIASINIERKNNDFSLHYSASGGNKRKHFSKEKVISVINRTNEWNEKVSRINLNKLLQSIFLPFRSPIASFIL
jgi:hypothetical protein